MISIIIGAITYHRCRDWKITMFTMLGVETAWFLFFTITGGAQ